MTSLKSKIFNFILRNRHLLQGKLRREVFTSQTSIPAFRELCEKGASHYARIPAGVVIKPAEIGGIRSEWIIPAGSDPAKVILYVHGGGYVSGSCNDHRGFVSKFARNCGYVNLVYEYRLSPEYPFPAALEDSVTVYQWLLSNGFSPANILVAGESAGGGLCLALLLALRDRDIPLPAAAVAISPWTDLTCSSDSYVTKNRVSLAPKDSWTLFSRCYAGSQDAANPLISPLFGDLAGLPPLLINAGMDDELFEDAEKFSVKAAKAGVNVVFRPGKGMVHCYPLLAPMFREATEAMEEICGFTKRQLG
ncbi:MAG: alpha/beta hydrolase [Bacteroidota bacterium]